MKTPLFPVVVVYLNRAAVCVDHPLRKEIDWFAGTAAQLKLLSALLRNSTVVLKLSYLYFYV